jgi:putative PIN family toxin of toxin-antitoxin system
MIFILDCNVWLDWLLFNDTSITHFKTGFEANEFTFLGTSHMRAELLDVLGRQSVGLKFIARSPFGSIEAMMEEYDRVVTPQSPPQPTFAPNLPICKDKDDQMFVDLVIATKAILVSKDRHLLAMAPKLKKQFGVLVMHPNKFKV